MVNPRALIWDPELAPARDLRALTTQPLSWSKVRTEASAARVRALARWMLAAPKRQASRLRTRVPREPAGANQVDDALERLRATGKRALLLFSDHEPLRDELTRSGQMAELERSENVTLEYVHVRDHTLRPNWAQRQAHEALDRALDRELGISRVAEPATRAS